LICASASACKTTCTVDSDCTTGNYCASGTCAPQKDNGGSCSAGNQCKNNHCVGNICCNTTCGQCNTCATGTCTPVTDLTGCGTGAVCVGGSCITCSQGASCTPSNACQTGTISCTTGASQCVANGTQPNGTGCGSGKVCSGGNCQTGCWIGGNFILSGAAGPSPCQVCNPAKSTTGWSNNDGATVACGTCGGMAACVNMAPGSCSKTATTYYRDADGDGYGDPANSTSSCSALSGYVSQGGDCDDSDGWVHPGGLGHCESYISPSLYDYNTLNTCNSNGTWSQVTCPNGCSAGQCRSLETVAFAGQVTCGALQCPTFQGCAFTSSGGDYHAVCNAGSASYSSYCDGPSDCSGGQVCCYISGVYAHQTQCMDSSSCPYPYNMGLTQGFLVCNPNVGGCTPPASCQMETASNIAFSIYTCR
jgi:hypothetical protein